MKTVRIMFACYAAMALLLIPIGGALADAEQEQDKQGSRIKTKKNKKGKTLEMSKTVSKTVNLKIKMGSGCKADLELEYYQKIDTADITTKITNPECAASSGDYTLQVSHRDDNGETVKDEYKQTWSRDSSDPVVNKFVFPIAKDSYLVRVRSRKLTCECADAPGAQIDTVESDSN